jgi:hypothetical protein
MREVAVPQLALGGLYGAHAVLNGIAIVPGLSM